MKNPYEILNVSKDASADQIKSSYRSLSKAYHPDVTKLDPEAAAEVMADISQAYEVLSDPAKRAQFDELGDVFDDEDKQVAAASRQTLAEIALNLFTAQMPIPFEMVDLKELMQNLLNTSLKAAQGELSSVSSLERDIQTWTKRLERIKTAPENDVIGEGLKAHIEENKKRAEQNKAKMGKQIKVLELALDLLAEYEFSKTMQGGVAGLQPGVYIPRQVPPGHWRGM